MSDNNGNDIFSVLGRIEVDMGALRASLGGAEAEVVASTNRQKKTWTDYANAVIAQQQRIADMTKQAQAGQGGGLYQEKFGSGGGGANGAAKAAADGFGKMREASERSIPSLRNFQHILNVIVPGLGGLAANVGMAATHMGIMGGAAVVLAITVHQLMTSLEEAEKAQEALNTAISHNDAEAASQEFLKYAESAEQARKGVMGLWRAVMGLQSVDTSRAKMALNAYLDILKSDETAETNAIQIRKIENDSLQKQEEYMLSLAGTAGELDKAQRNLNVTRRNGLNIAESEARNALMTSKEYKEREKYAQGQEANALLLQTISDKFAAQRKAQGEQEIRDAEGLEQKKAQIAVRANDRAIKALALEKSLSQDRFSTTKAIIEAEQQLAATTANFNGQALTNTKEYLDKKFAVTKKELELEQLAQQETYEQNKAKLNRLIAGGGPNVEQYRDQLRDLDKENDIANQRFLEKGKQNAVAEANERIKARKQEIQERLKLEDDAFNQQAALGQKSLKDQMEYAKAIVGDSNRSKQERDAAEVRAFSIYKQEAEAYFSLRKSMGEETLGDEVKFQENLNKLYREGSADWYNGTKKVYDLQKQMREESKSVFQQITGAAAEYLKKTTGRTDFTAGELQAAAGKVSSQQQGTLSKFGSGGRVNVDELFKAQNMQEGFEKFYNRGGSLRQEFEGSLSTPGFKPAGFSTFAGGGPTGEYTKPLQAVGESFRTAVDTFQDAVDTFSEAAAASGGQASTSEAMGRALYLENKRGPVQQESAQ